MRSLSLITIWPAIHFYSKLTISLLTILSKTGPPNPPPRQASQQAQHPQAEQKHPQAELREFTRTQPTACQSEPAKKNVSGLKVGRTNLVKMLASLISG